jgi:hypothetical protein
MKPARQALALVFLFVLVYLFPLISYIRETLLY